MLRVILLAGLMTLTAGCSLQPLVTKTRMTLGEANIQNMECRREPPPNSSIPKTTCASEKNWRSWDKRQADTSAEFIDLARDSNDNRIFYPE